MHNMLSTDLNSLHMLNLPYTQSPARGAVCTYNS